MGKLRVLKLNLKTKHYNDIDSNIKKLEYRLVTPYWNARLLYREYDEIIICKGYPKKDDMTRQIRFKWNGATIVKDFQHDEFGPRKVMVYAVDLSERL